MPVDFKGRREDDVRVEITPLIDVIFQLLVFFMLSSSFLFPNLDLVLPKLDESEDEMPEQPRLVISLDANGDVYLNSESVARDAFIPQLQRALSDGDLTTVFFRGDENLAYREIVQIMRESSEAGVVQFNFLYEPSP